jgi:hypothetical protein
VPWLAPTGELAYTPDLPPEIITRLSDQSSAHSVLRKRVIRIAVQPALAGFRRCYDRVFTRAGVFRGVFVGESSQLRIPRHS